PGHSPGSVAYFLAEQGMVIAGDALFAGSIGRTDLPGGDFDTLIQSIKAELFTLPDETIVYPGHGPQQQWERKRNIILSSVGDDQADAQLLERGDFKSTREESFFL